MHHDLKHRIQAMRDKLEGRAPVAEIQGSSQLFVTPSPECRRLVELADVRETDRILEPSAGTGAILQAIRDAVPRAKCDAVELHAGLARHLQAHFPEVRIWCGDFLEYHPERRYTRIIMNPPFNRGDDIRHTCVKAHRSTSRASCAPATGRTMPESRATSPRCWSGRTAPCRCSAAAVNPECLRAPRSRRILPPRHNLLRPQLNPRKRRAVRKAVRMPPRLSNRLSHSRMISHQWMMTRPFKPR